MIISRTPLRMSFVGGGSDMPEFYRRHRGAVVSTAIDKYVYVNINRKFDGGIRLAYSKTAELDAVGDPVPRDGGVLVQREREDERDARRLLKAHGYLL